MSGRSFWEYAVLMAVLVLLQVLLLDNLGLGLYIVPQVYILLIAMLPSRTPPAATMLWALLLGVVMDMLSGTAGLNVIALVCTSFCRKWIMNATLGVAAVREGVIALPAKVGGSKVLRYLLLLTAVNFTVYFIFEALSFRFFYLTLIKIVLSTAVSALLCYLCILLFWGRHNKK